MSDTLLTCLFSLAGTLVGTFGGIYTTMRLTNYRLEQLEKKVEVHNSVVERMTVAEREIKSVWHVIGELEEEKK